MKKLNGKVALVTGSAKGIGAAIAQYLAEEGASVIVNYAKSKSQASEVVSRIRDSGGTAVDMQGDVSQLEDVQRLFGDIKKQFGKLDILVNNAGIYELAPLAETTTESFHRMFNTNVLGVIQVTREAVKIMSEGGVIVNISSIAARSPSTMNSIYAATKGALDTLTLAFARELGPRKIRVNAINPGMVETEGFVASGAKETSWYTESIKNTPLGRIAQPDDIAKVAVFLASEDSGWISGESILVAGGRR